MNILHMLKHDFLIIGFAGPLRSGCTTSAEFFTNGLQKEIQNQTRNYGHVQKEIEVLYRKTHKHKESDGSRQSEQFKNDLRQLLKKREALKVLSDYANNNFVYISMTDILIKSSVENMGEEIKLAYNYQKSKAKFEILKGLMRKITSDYPDIRELKRLSSYTKERDFNKFKKGDFLKFEQYLQRLRETRRKLPKWLSYDDDLIGELLQDFGDNLRRYGNPWDYKTPYSISNPSTVFTLAEEANNIIKVFRSRERQKEAKRPRVKQFVVEAFRNPYEVEFFRNRYHEFYLISLFTDYEIRSKRGAFSLKRDERDRGEDLTTEEFYNQNVSECVRLSDIAINNERRKPELYEKLMIYFALIKQPGCFAPEWEETAMHMAYSMSVKSTCISRQVGAVIEGVNGYIIGAGWNDVGAGQVGCGYRHYEDFTNLQEKYLISNPFGEGEFRNRLNRLGSGRIQESFCYKDEYGDYVIRKKLLKKIMKERREELRVTGVGSDQVNCLIELIISKKERLILSLEHHF